MKKTLACITAVLILSAPAFAARPLNTDDAGTVDQGKFEIEAGVEVEKAKDIDETATGLAVQVKYGILDNLDAGIEIPYAASDPSGIGDATVKGKINFVEETESAPAISLGIDIKLANGDKDQGLGTGYVDYGINGILSKEFGPAVCHANLGYTIVGVEEGTDSENTISYGIAVEFPVDDQLTVVGEIFGASVENASANPLDLQIGGYWSINDTARVDGGLDFGLSDASPEYKATVGITLNL